MRNQIYRKHKRIAALHVRIVINPKFRSASRKQVELHVSVIESLAGFKNE